MMYFSTKLSNSYLTIATACLSQLSLVSAVCNPTETSCPAVPALGTSINVDFTAGSSSYFTPQTSAGEYTYSSETGLGITINQRYQYPYVQSSFYIMFGKIEAVVQAAPGTGIVSSVVLLSDDGDEIDLEWLGGDTSHVQTNYFSKGYAGNYDRGTFVEVAAPQSQFHTYTIDWGMDELVWSIDGNVVRTLSSSNPQGYPQTPSVIKIGSWAGGDPSNSEGTISWAGGETDFTQAPFSFYVESINVQDYSTGTEYAYTGTSGEWSSIEAVGGSINGRVDEADSLLSTETAIEKATVTSSSISQIPSVAFNNYVYQVAHISSNSSSTNSTKSSSSTSTASVASTANSSNAIYAGTDIIGKLLGSIAIFIFGVLAL